MQILQSSLLVVIVAILGYLVGQGIAVRVFDYRLFSEIELECLERGWIQTDATRIYCHVELPPPPPPTNFRPHTIYQYAQSPSRPALSHRSSSLQYNERFQLPE